jgi:hypothetical protein
MTGEIFGMRVPVLVWKIPRAIHHDDIWIVQMLLQPGS